MKNRFDVIPQVIVHPNQIITYNQIRWNVPHAKRQNLQPFESYLCKPSEKFLKSTRKSNGNVSEQAKRKMTKAITYLVTTSSNQKVYERISNKMVLFSIAFITLTLPSKQLHPDSEITSKCLNSFLLELKQYYQVANYVWRAEKQKNGNIHYHLLINKFVPYYELRNRWNRIINKLGYVDRYRENMREFYKQGFRITTNKNDKRPEALQFISYKRASSTNFSQPNSTDIHSTRKIKNVAKYVTKYMSKNETIQPNQPTPDQAANDKDSQASSPEPHQTGRIWACSQNLSGISGFASEIDSEIDEALKALKSNPQVHCYEQPYFTVLTCDYSTLPKLGAECLFRYFADYLIDQFNFHPQIKLL